MSLLRAMFLKTKELGSAILANSRKASQLLKGFPITNANLYGAGFTRELGSSAAVIVDCYFSYINWNCLTSLCFLSLENEREE